jgi:hypothetical protein
MRCGRKTRHVWSDLGQDDLDAARPNARDSVEPLDQLVVGLEPTHDFLVDALNAGVDAV